MLGHGGFFKTPGVGAQVLADALHIPICTMETAGEGGPWGMALLASYMCRRRPGESLETYLADRVFRDARTVTAKPDAAGAAGFAKYMENYHAALACERAAEGLR